MIQETIQKVIDGDVRAVARLIRDIDDGMPGVRGILKELYAHTGNAYIIGITGAGGFLGRHLCAVLRQRFEIVGTDLETVSPCAKREPANLREGHH